MPLPKSHKNPAAYSEHLQARTHAPIGSTYGQEENQNPKRKVGRPALTGDPDIDRLQQYSYNQMRD